MRSADVRAAFIDFFQARGHEVVRSSSLIPSNDPTLLFTNAGMVQFKSVFLGEELRSNQRAVSSQKCMRAGGKHNDLENVGHTARHHTFFEMLGNFSFGDYFKRDAILFAWELLTEQYGLPKDRLWATVYEDDDEAALLWHQLTGIPTDRIVRLGAKDNFWQMGDTGPCGPCSEIVIDQGSGIGCGRPDCAVGCDCDRYLEIWNLVFMQFNRDRDGTLTPLPKPSIDTGMGLERLTAVLQGKQNNFDTDLFGPIISAIAERAGKRYGADRLSDTAMRVVADHVRATTFLLSEGLVPSNEGRGYVLRRIIRRAARYAKSLGIDEPVLSGICDAVIESVGSAYPELRDEKARVKRILQLEEERFNRTLEQGLGVLNAIIAGMKKTGDDTVPGAEIFKLYDTYGFPVDIARDIAAENGLRIDEAGFHREMEAQKTKARASWVGESAGADPVYRELARELPASEFLGYETMESDATVLAVVHGGQVTSELVEGAEGEVILDRTPFYAESGGQVGDSGEFHAAAMQADVRDTRKPLEGLCVHTVRVKTGRIRTGERIQVSVDRGKRLATMRNHTATHLLHAALRQIVGSHVKQAGSLVAPERLRFDFTNFTAMDTDTIQGIEERVNSDIIENIPLETSLMETDEAVKSGATALFGEKYGDRVRVVRIPGKTSELCGGTHVRATGDIGLFKIVSESSVAAGIRRIEALTGMASLAYVRGEERALRMVCEALKVSDEPVERLQKVLAEMKELERTVEKLKGRSAAERSAGIIGAARTIKGIKVIAHRADGLAMKDLRVLADNVRDLMGSGILVLASVKDNQASLVAMVTRDLASRFDAGRILRELAARAGGSGGGKADVAQGGTKEIDKLDKALESLYDSIHN